MTNRRGQVIGWTVAGLSFALLVSLAVMLYVEFA